MILGGFNGKTAHLSMRCGLYLKGEDDLGEESPDDQVPKDSSSPFQVPESGESIIKYGSGKKEEKRRPNDVMIPNRP